MTNSPTIRRSPGAHWVGDGFPVHSLFSYADGPKVSPFLLLDYAPPTHFAPSRTPRGVGPHPHRGFETVTIVYAGEVAHRDSAGHGGTIGRGDVQWMTAARGVVHEELHGAAFTRHGGELEMVQLWVNLPASAKMSSPRYQDLRDAAFPRHELANGAGSVRVIAGEYGSARGPARTVTPVHLWDVDLHAGGRLPIALPATFTRMVLVRRGAIEIDGAPVVAGELAQFATGASEPVVRAGAANAQCLVLAGEPIDEPVVGHGPFVMNTRAEIATAIADYQAGRMGEL